MRPAWWQPRDPDGVSLRRALRTAVVLPVLFAGFVVGVDSPQAAAFAAFGGFALLGFADFLGPPPRRALAYVIATTVGGVLVVVGTLASPYAVVAAVGMGFVAFGARFATVYGGAFTPALAPVILSYALASTLAGDAGDITARLLGWFVAGAASVVAALVLWPAYPRDALLGRTAVALRSLAEVVAGRFVAGAQLDDGSVAGDGAPPLAPVGDFGPGTRNRAIVCLVHETERLGAFLRELAPIADIAAPDAAHTLAIDVRDTLQASADALAGQGREIPTAQLHATHLAYDGEVGAWAESALRAGHDAEQVLAALDASHSLRTAALRTREIARHVLRVLGLPADPDAFDDRPASVRVSERGSVLRAAVISASAHLRPGDVLFRNALRSGIGVGLAVLVAGLVGASHVFWVALAAFLILRSSALGTGYSALQALVGTLVGFALGAGFLVAVDVRREPLWVALPVLVFLAGYAPTALSFVVGQAAFTLLVLDLFNILEPEGWELGVARVEDIALGAGISVIVGLLFWPRGARGALGEALGDAFRHGADHLDATLADLLGEGSPAADATTRAEALGAAQRAEVAFAGLLDEGGSMPVSPDTWGGLLLAANRLRVACDWFELVAETTGDARGCAPAQMIARRDGHAIAQRFRAVADELEGTPMEPIVVRRSPDDTRRAAALECLRTWSRDPGVRLGAKRALWANDWLHRLDDLADEVAGPARKVRRVQSIPWWR